MHAAPLPHHGDRPETESPATGEPGPAAPSGTSDPSVSPGTCGQVGDAALEDDSSTSHVCTNKGDPEPRWWLPPAVTDPNRSLVGRPETGLGGPARVWSSSRQVSLPPVLTPSPHVSFATRAASLTSPELCPRASRDIVSGHAS